MYTLIKTQRLKHYIITGILGCILPLYSLKAQDTTSLKFSLDEAIKYAIQNNEKSKNARLDVAISKKKVWETTAIGLPQVSAVVSYQNIFEVPMMSFDSTTPPFPLGVKENITTDITVSQLLFSGEYIVGLQASRAYKQFSDQNLIKTTSNITEAVTTAYYQVLITEENKVILEQGISVLEQIFTETYALYEAGFAEETDADQIKLSLERQKNVLSNAKRMLELSYESLKFRIGISPEQNISLSNTLNEAIETADLESVLSQALNLNNNIDYQIISTNEKLMLLSLRREKSKFLPNVSAFYRHQELKEKPPMNFNPPNVIGINVSIPIFGSGMKVFKVQQAKYELEKTSNLKAQTANALKLQDKQLRSNLTTALEKYLSEKNNLALTEKIYKHTIEKYKNGLSSSMDVSQSQNQHLQTQSAYYNAIFELLNAKNKLDNILNNY